MSTSTTVKTAGPSVWAGRVLSGLAIAFLLFDAVIKLPPIGQ